MFKINQKTKSILLVSFLALLFLGSVYFIYALAKLPSSMEKDLNDLGKMGEIVRDNLWSADSLIIEKGDKNYAVSDFMINGPVVKVAGSDENVSNKKMQIEFPKKYNEMINIKLDEQRIIGIKDNNGEGYRDKVLVKESISVLDELINKEKDKKNRYLKYDSQDGRKSIYYAYQKNETERDLKNWIIYKEQSESGEEKESYQISNAKIKLNDAGEVEVFYFGEKQIQNEKTMAEVDGDLLARAQRTMMEETGQDILNSDSYEPDFIIPKPYYLDKNGERMDLKWEINQDNNEISLKFSVEKNKYPIALDPTFQFIAPGAFNSGTVIQNLTDYGIGNTLFSGDFNNDSKTDLVVGNYSSTTNYSRIYIFYNNNGISVTNAGGADVIITEEMNSNFGSSFANIDLNDDGKKDLIVASNVSNSGAGCVYVFYNDSEYPANAFSADIIIYGEAGSNFGISMTSGDLNSDGDIDLIVGAWLYSTSTGRAYIFYNDGTIPTTASTANVIITGETTNNYFGWSMTTGDYDYDSDTDLAIGAYYYSSYAGRAYIFYNDGTIPTTAGTADVIITGDAGSSFSYSMISGDFNYDGRIDLSVGSTQHTGSQGRVYIFYNDGTIPTTAATADVAIAGESGTSLTWSMSAGDFNYDGRTDIVATARFYNSNMGRAYIFYNDGTYPASATSADVIISGESSSNYFSMSTSGDFNNDGRVDFAVGAYGYSGTIGRVYIFNNDGNIPTTAPSADRIISGTSNYGNFGYFMVSGDFSGDGKEDLAVSGDVPGNNRVFIFYGGYNVHNYSVGANLIIVGDTSTSFGTFMIKGDFNGDNKTDLAIGAPGYSSNTGRAYVFYNDGSMPTSVASADITITGQSTGNYFGASLASGNFDGDRNDDLVVGAYGFFSNYGRAYVFYMDGSIPSPDAADIKITGETTNNYLGSSVASGDLNYDGKSDLITGAYGYDSNRGRVYVAYNDASMPEIAQSADVIITGEMTGSYFGNYLKTGNLNSDLKMDLVVGAWAYNSNTGRSYIFYQDGTFATGAGNADVVINGDANSRFGYRFDIGDLNGDGKDDLVVSGYYSGFYYGAGSGSVYIFYNDGNYPATSIDADVLIGGEGSNHYFGTCLAVGDFDGDSKKDLAAGTPNYATNVGRAYIFYFDKLQSDQTGIINNDGNNSQIGYSIASGDMNGDNKIDLIIGSTKYLTNTGRVYIFYNDGSYPTAIDGADKMITGEAQNNQFGAMIKTGDLNNDSKVDLIVGAIGYSTNTGRVYVFYNDGNMPNEAIGAEIIFTGETTSNYFGMDFAAGDFNYDNKIDFAISSPNYSSNTGRVYIFYNDGTMPALAASADVKIDGYTTSNYFGYALASGDFNYDSKTDLAVGAYGYSSTMGQAYIFYNDGAYSSNTTGADVTITGETNNNYFGYSLLAGDFNYDGRTDLVAGAFDNSSSTGRTYIFYNDGTYPSGAASAEVVISGEANLKFGISLASADFNDDGRMDLLIGGYGYSSQRGRVYIFYNDGTYPSSTTSADVTITGEPNVPTSGNFGWRLTAGDFNNDGVDDLAVGAYGYSTSTGRTYIIYSDGSIQTDASLSDVIITGETDTTSIGDAFGYTLDSGDLNQDGKVDLVVGAYQYPANTSAPGRAYIFYNKSSFDVTSDKADVIIEGEYSSGGNFSSGLKVGDINNDRKDDLIVGGYQYSNGNGRVYLFYSDGTNNFGTANCTGSAPTICQSSNADIKINGETSSRFGEVIELGDLNNDNKNDLIVGSPFYSSWTGRVYVFYQDVVYPNAGSANVIIAGTANSYFGCVLNVGDFNVDGKLDLAIGSNNYSSGQGMLYLFYNDGSYPTTAGTADVTITGDSASARFGCSVTSMDINNDNKTDLIVGGYSANSNAGRVYIFYADGTNNYGTATCSGTSPTTCASANADLIINNSSYGGNFGTFLKSGDANNDGKSDLVVSATSKIFVFYNDGIIPNNTTGADLSIGSEAVASGFGWIFSLGDFNNDKVIDLVTGASTYNSTQGRVYLFSLKGSVVPESFTKIYGGVNFQGGAQIQQ